MVSAHPPHPPRWNTSLGGGVVSISIATSLKRQMIINPAGGEIRLICIYPRHHAHKYQSIKRSLTSGGSDLFTLSEFRGHRGRALMTADLLERTPAKGNSAKVTAVPRSAADGGCCENGERELLSSVFASDGSC